MGLTWTNLGHALATFLFTFLAQQIGYKALVQNGDAGGKSNVRNILPIVVVLALVAPLTGCASKARVTKVDAGIYTSLAAVQDVEMTLHTNGVIADDLHGRINQRLAGVLKLGFRFNALVRDWPVGTPKPPEIGVLAFDIAKGLHEMLALLPNTPTVTTLRLYVESAIGLIQPFVGA